MTDHAGERGCSAETTEPFALRVMGDSMVPEFHDGHIIIIDPGIVPRHGMFVVLNHDQDTLFGQYQVREGRRWLVYLNPAFDAIELSGIVEFKGVIVQRATGRRRQTKIYEY